MQFLTFKLSFNDYYAQDISNKIKSVKQRKIEKGEYQAGIPPYGYKKDPEIKNHLIPDEYSSQIVKEIFDMYVNKGMSTIKIADDLNQREILPPAIYLKIPTYMKKISSNPDGKYVWIRTQIGKMLRNEVYLGNVVGRKFQKVSHKIAKVRATQKEEHIVLKNMHQPIIDRDIWDRAQEKLNSYTKVRNRKYDHPLKGVVYCGECGNKATIRCREEKRKNGTVWRATYFICSKRNNYISLCECKQISGSLLEEAVNDKIREEIEKISFSEEEINNIYEDAKKEARSKYNILEIELDKSKDQLKEIEKSIEETYQDKINKIIQIEDFKMIYEKMQKKRNKILQEIRKIEKEIKENKKSSKIDDKEIRNIAQSFLETKWKNKIVLERLIEKIEFDKEKNIKLKLTFNRAK